MGEKDESCLGSVIVGDTGTFTDEFVCLSVGRIRFMGADFSDWWSGWN